MMTPSNPFPYDPSRLTSCAQTLFSKEASNNSTDILLSSSECHKLFLQHQSFYKRSLAHSRTPGRFDQFIENVLFVYSHNKNYESSSYSSISHYVTLNQFSDVFDHELPYFSSQEQWSTQLEERIDVSETKTQMKNCTRCEEHDNLVNQNFQTTSLFYMKRHRNHGPKPLEDNQNNGSRTYKGQYYLLGGINNTSDRTTDPKTFAYDFITRDDNWNTNLNWATEENPDGVAIVHPAIDQGICGSCWSFAALGSLAANAARNAAMDVFYSHLSPEIMSISASWKRNDTAIARNKIDELIPKYKLNNAIKKAQIVENKAFDKARFSVQELVDCDTKYNQGCVGGNPVMTFPFIHRYGIVSSADYPYKGVQQQCQRKYAKNPIATTESWGIVKPKDESNMEFALRHIGPLSAGFNVGDKSFLSYSGGIFDSKTCSKHPNHAMLITGYGEEIMDGKPVQYWIARNSWGTGWGENGYIRIKRKFKRRSSGVCGIGNNLSVSIGGYLIGIDSHAKGWLGEKSMLGQEARDFHMDLMSTPAHFKSIHHRVNFLSPTAQLCIFVLFGIYVSFMLTRRYILWPRSRISTNLSRDSLIYHLDQEQTSLNSFDQEQYYGSTLLN